MNNITAIKNQCNSQNYIDVFNDIKSNQYNKWIYLDTKTGKIHKNSIRGAIKLNRPNHFKRHSRKQLKQISKFNHQLDKVVDMILKIPLKEALDSNFGKALNKVYEFIERETIHKNESVKRHIKKIVKHYNSNQKRKLQIALDVLF